MGSDESYAYPLHYPLNVDENYGNKGSPQLWANLIKADTLAFLCDPFMIRWLVDKKIVQKDGQDVVIRARDEIPQKLLFYFPFDSPDVYMGAEDVLRVMDTRVAMSKFGQKLLKDKTGLDSFYIPHGVDTNIYRPLKEEFLAAKRKELNVEGKFIIGSVARNQTRKMHPQLLYAFKRFHKLHPESILLMHMDPVDPNGWNMIDLCGRMGLEVNKDVVFTMKKFTLGENESTVNFLYNMMDLHITSTSGEGFSIPTIESQAAGTLSLATDCTTSPELLEDPRLLIKKVGLDDVPEEGYLIGQLNTQRAVPSIKDMTDKMCYFYDNEDERRKLAKIRRDKTINTYNWEKVVRAWLELFEQGKITEYDQGIKEDI
jgi:glycosyltransferase involved in cell wall biosynthesis